MNKKQILFARLAYGVGLLLFCISAAYGTLVGMILVWVTTGVIAFTIVTKSVLFVNWNLAKTGLLTVFVLFGLSSLQSLYDLSARRW